MNPVRHVSLEVEIRCACQAPNSIYRIYIDNELLTERTWRYDSSIAVNEHIQVNLYIGQHKLRLEPVNCSQTNFSLHQFKINNFLLHPAVRGLETTFVVDAASPPAA